MHPFVATAWPSLAAIAMPPFAPTAWLSEMAIALLSFTATALLSARTIVALLLFTATEWLSPLEFALLPFTPTEWLSSEAVELLSFTATAVELESEPQTLDPLATRVVPWVLTHTLPPAPAGAANPINNPAALSAPIATAPRVRRTRVRLIRLVRRVPMPPPDRRSAPDPGETILIVLRFTDRYRVMVVFSSCVLIPTCGSFAVF